MQLKFRAGLLIGLDGRSSVPALEGVVRRRTIYIRLDVLDTFNPKLCYDIANLNRFKRVNVDVKPTAFAVGRERNTLA